MAAGSSQTRAIVRPSRWPASTSGSPMAVDPSSYSAHNVACSVLTGQTLPLHPSSRRSPSTAARKSPLYCSIIDRRRFPPVWPARRSCSSVGSRASSTRRASASLRASASVHLSTSPGGRTPSSSRRTPELPPLSNIVTTACTRSHGLRFNPPSRLGRPVPPPKQPIFSSLSSTGHILASCPQPLSLESCVCKLQNDACPAGRYTRRLHTQSAG